MPNVAADISSDEILTYLRENKAKLKDEYHVVRIGLFGSFSRGDATNSGDIDLLVELEEGVMDIYSAKKNLKNFIYARFLRPVDIATPKYLKPYAKEDILKETVYA